MKRNGRFAMALAVGLLGLPATVWVAPAQTPAASAPEAAEAVLGVWEMHPIEADGEPPPPPPIYASYRKNEPPLEKISRVVFQRKDGELLGKAVFAEGIVVGEDGGGVEGRPEVELREVDYANGQLRFKATVDGEDFEAKASLAGPRKDRFEGFWESGQRKGKLFLNRRK